MESQTAEVHKYIKNHVNPFIEPMIYDLVLKRPGNPIEYAITWLKNYCDNQLQTKMITESDGLSEMDEQSQDEMRELQTKIQQNRSNRKHYKNRISISEQSFGMFNYPKDIVEKAFRQITDGQMQLIRPLLTNSILFETLDNKDEEIIFQSIKIKQTDEHQLIIKEGQEGDLLYVVQSGEYDCYKIINGENMLVKTYYPGETFGDLALMYNCPRLATIVTKKPGKLLTLDRSTFSRILKVAAMRKQSIIKNAIQNLDLNLMIPVEQRSQLITIFEEEKFIGGEYIVREGDLNNKLYVVLEGVVVSEGKEDKGNQNNILGEGCCFNQVGFWKKGTCFGVKAVTGAKLATLSCVQFKRVFGQIWEQLSLKK